MDGKHSGEHDQRAGVCSSGGWDGDNEYEALAIGDGANSNRFEIYAAGSDGRAYQFQAEPVGPTPTPTVTPTATPAPEKQLRAYPSRINPEKGESVSIRWYQLESTGATIRIYNLRGELVETLADRVYYEKGQEHEIKWPGVNNAGATVASGIYIVHIKAGLYEDHIKIAVLK